MKCRNKMKPKQKLLTKLFLGIHCYTFLKKRSIFSTFFAKTSYKKF